MNYIVIIHLVVKTLLQHARNIESM